MLADLCIDGITANREFLRLEVENSIGLVTALAPTLGYEAAASIAKYAQSHNCSVREAGLALGLLTNESFDELLGDIRGLTGS